LNIVNVIGNLTFMSTFKLNDSIIWHASLGQVHFKRMQDMSKDELIPAFDIDTEKFFYVNILHAKDETLDKFKVFKTEVELQQGSLIKRFRTDRGGLSQGFWGVAMAVVRLPDPKLKLLGERGIECLFVGYVEHSKAFRHLNNDIKSLMKWFSSCGYLLNQADRCVYSKFDETGKGVIICPYVDDMLIFGTDQIQVDLTNDFLSSSLTILIRVIGCLMYTMTCIRHDIAFAVGKLSRYTSNPGTQHWQAIQWVLKYLKKTMDYRLTYTGYPLMLEGYTDASWISNTEDNSSTTLAAAGKEAEWLNNLLFEILLWSKPIAPISIRCDSAATW
ncbi:hypothetical protein Tco_0787349, partial [Tanacetum coccineum]